MSLADAFAPAEARYKAQVMFDTFGHLYPQPGNKYQGRIVFVISAYGGNCCILHSEWQGLEDSPLLFETMSDVFDNSRVRGRHDIFEWTGELICYKNGNTRLTKGKLKVRHKVA